jgi:hypothetical protein
VIKTPAHWIKGQLLDLKRYGDGTYRAVLLGEEIDPEAANFIELDSSCAAQQFISDWYAPAPYGNLRMI